VRLVFPGTRHPNPAMADFPTGISAARALAAELGLLDQHVFFGDWIPYADWPAVLLESDLALALHASETLESRLAFRSRVLEYIWAGLPTVATRGDATGDLIAQYGLGIVVDAGRADQVAEAMAQLLTRPRVALADGFEPARQALNWTVAAAPLQAFGRAPWRAADGPSRVEARGNPLYLDELERLRGRLQQYEGRRSIRFLHWLLALQQRLAARLAGNRRSE
jgi:hypothetical protein